MLHRTNAEVAFYYQRADENRRMAEQQTDPELRNTCLDLEQRWRKLGLSYENPHRFIQSAVHLACALDEMKQA
jgi:hypothetical protein